MVKLANRVYVTTATTGTGDVVLGAAFNNVSCTFDESGVEDGDVVTYCIDTAGSFEIGRGTYSASGQTLSRDTVFLSKIMGVAGTSKIDLGGLSTVRIVAAREDFADRPTVQDVDAAVANAIQLLVGASPEDMDTIYELAEALDNNPDVLAAIQAAIMTKASIANDNTFGGIQTFENWITLQRALEKFHVVGAAPGGAMQFDVLTAGIQYWNILATSNFTLNIRADATNPLVDSMPIKRVLTVVLEVVNGATPYYLTALTIDGVAVNVKWANGMVPTAGTAWAREAYTFAIHRHGGGEFQVLASLTPYT
jgi:hypothetical protein